MSGGDHSWFKRRSARHKRPVTGDIIIIIIIIIIINLYFNTIPNSRLTHLGHLTDFYCCVYDRTSFLEYIYILVDSLHLCGGLLSVPS